MDTLVLIFNNMQEGNNTVSMETIRKFLQVESHPRVKLMLKNRDLVAQELEFSFLFVSGDKGYLDINEFIEFHRNMYWVQPKENLTNFYKMICDLWGFKN